MRTLTQKRLDHDTVATVAASGCGALALLAFTLAGVLGAPAAHAQGSVPCTAIVDDAERLACYDRALRGTTAAPAAAPAPTTERSEEPRHPARDVREAAAPAPAAPAAPAAAPAPAAPPAAAAVRSPEIAVMSVVVVGIRALPGRNATFTTEDGQVWIQTDSQTAPFPDTPFAAQIKPGAIGSFFLVPTERGRAVRVRRANR